MTMPSSCPKCQAPFPESIERFGANTACRVCGQILRFEEESLLAGETTSSLRRPERPVETDDDETDDDVPMYLPPTDQLMTEGWQIFRDQMGLCIGIFVLSFVLNMLAQAPEMIARFLLEKRQFQPREQALLIAGLVVATICRIAFSMWLNIGLYQFFLKVVRGQPAGVGDLFRGGRFFWRTLLCSLVMSLAMLTGALLCVVPGVIIALMYWPFLYVLIDRDLPGLDSLWKASEITFGNKWNLFGLMAICFLINMFGVLACGVGALISMPYSLVVVTLAYHRMSGLTRYQQSALDDEDDD